MNVISVQLPKNRYYTSKQKKKKRDVPSLQDATSHYSSCTSRSSENISCSSSVRRRLLRQKERQDETQFTTKIDGKTSLGPSYISYWKKISFPVPHLIRKKERQDETQFTTKIDGKTSLGPSSIFLLEKNFHSKFRVSCPIMLKLAVLAS